MSADFWVLSTYFCQIFSTFCCINININLVVINLRNLLKLVAFKFEVGSAFFCLQCWLHHRTFSEPLKSNISQYRMKPGEYISRTWRLHLNQVFFKDLSSSSTRDILICHWPTYKHICKVIPTLQFGDMFIRQCKFRVQSTHTLIKSIFRHTRTEIQTPALHASCHLSHHTYPAVVY